jgi:serine/threonine protein phosphatase PrpC
LEFPAFLGSGCLPYLDLQLGGKREKAPASSPSLRFPAAVAEMKGRRRTMEDYVMVWYAVVPHIPDPPLNHVAAPFDVYYYYYYYLFIYLFIILLRVNRGNFRGRGEEDYFSLFDGHGGSDASLFACENLHFQVSSAVSSFFFAFAFSASFAL